MLKKITTVVSNFIEFTIKHYTIFACINLFLLLVMPWFITWRSIEKKPLDLSTVSCHIGFGIGSLMMATLLIGERTYQRKRGQLFEINTSGIKLFKEAQQYLEHLTPDQTFDLMARSYLSILRDIKEKDAEILIRVPGENDLISMNDFLLGMKTDRGNEFD